MLSDVKYLLSTFSKVDRVKLAATVVMQFIISLMDLVGIAAILPILQILTGAPLDEGYVAVLYEVLGRPERSNFALVLTVAMVMAFALKSLFGLMLQWWSSGLIARLQVDTASGLVRSYLSGSFLARRGGSLADLGRITDTGMNDAFGKVLASLMQLANSILSIVTIMGFLILVQPIATGVTIVYFGMSLILLQIFLGQRNHRVGGLAVEAAWRRSFVMVDIVEGFRETRLHNAQAWLASRYDEANEKALFLGRKAGFLAVIPRYALELITIVGISLLLVLSVLLLDSAEILTLMGLFVAVAVRLMPTLSGFSAQLGFLRSGQVGLKIVVNALKEEQIDGATLEVAPTPTISSRHSLQSIQIRNLSYRYPDSAGDVLRDIDIEVRPGSSLAIVGMSGSGKTTLVDLILGLHKPHSGQISYGDSVISDLGRDWYEIVAYVPQDVYLVDDSILANVAYGVAPEKIDHEKVRRALQQAQMDRVVDSLSEGVLTSIGGRGVRLSGGQRQRLGIARALYRDPRVIILDEATSALDNATEQEIAQTIRSLSGRVTTIQVAHRLSTVKNVDEVIYLRNGFIEGRGTFAEVESQSDEFARMVRLGDISGTLNAMKSTD